MLQAVPALRVLRRRGPLTFAGQPRLGELLRALDLVDAALSFDGLGLEALFTREPLPPPVADRLGAFGQVVSWFGARDDLYPERLRAVAGGCVIAPPAPSDGSPLTVWRHLLVTIGATAPPDVTPVRVSDGRRRDASRTLAGLGLAAARPLLVVHPGAGGRAKLWPVERHARVLERVIRETDGQALIHQGPADAEVAEQLWRVHEGRALRLVEPDLPLLAAILSRAAAYLGGDSGVSHLAATVGAPAVILFPADTRARWAPWSPTASVMTMSEDAEQIDQVAAAVTARMRVPRSAMG